MKRYITDYLIDWKDREHIKPLIIRGARQVGKSYSVEEFGQNHFSEVIKVNFEENPELKDFFTTNDVLETIQNLEIYFGQKIMAAKVLLFIDEIQACPQAIVSLRYFYEKIPKLHIIAAGSLLDHTLNDLQYSMPVGRVEFAYMYPLNYYEFLIAIGEQALVKFLQNYQLSMEIAEPIHNKLIKLLRIYFFIGGMPEVIKQYVKTKSLADSERIHESIIKSFEFDFSKYGTRVQQHIMVKLLNYLPKVTGQKFKYSNFDSSLRSDAIKRSLVLLQMSRLVSLIYHTKASGTPLKHGEVEKIFKTNFLDIGLANHILKLRLIDINTMNLVNEGNLAEQFIGQELLSMPPYFLESNVYYWMREKRNSEAELDYLIQSGNKIIPIEVKAGKTGSMKSLQVFIAEKKLKQAIRFNTDFPSTTRVKTKVKINKEMSDVDFQLISLPLYLVQEFDRFL